MNYFIGVDPGKKGAMAIIKESFKEDVKVLPFDEREYLRAIDNLNFTVNDRIICCLERVNAMPGQGVKSMFSFGQNFGWIQGMLMAFDIPFETVPPQKWKKEFSLGKDKKASIDAAHKLFPNVSLRPTERCKVDNDGMAEALLMAEYARRKM